MNVKRQSVWQRLKRSSFLISLLLLSINGAQNASADEFFLTSLWTDPLKSTPSILKDPQPLPGDDTSIQCNFNIEPNGILTLAKAIDITLCKNPQIKTEWTNIKIQAAAKGEASSAYLPTLSASVSKMHDETYYPGSQTPSTLNQSTGLYANLNWRIFDFGERKANYQAADALLQSAIFTLNATTQKTILSTIQSYFDALTALEVYNAKTHSMQLAYDTLSIVKKREAKGVASQSDTLQAITAYAKASLEMNRALGDFKKSKALLVYTLGLAANTPIQLDQSIDIKSGHEINELQRWLEETEKTHPAILAAKAQIDAAKLKIDATDSGGMPTLDLSGSFYQNGRPSQGMTPNRTQEEIVGVTLTIPIFEGFSRIYKVREAQTQLEQKEVVYLDTKQQVLMEVVKAHADASSSLSNLQASEDLLNAAKNSLAASQRRYEKGVADILELLTTQNALSDAQLERIRCQAEWRSARLRLLATTGIIGRSAIQ